MTVRSASRTGVGSSSMSGEAATPRASGAVDARPRAARSIAAASVGTGSGTGHPSEAGDAQVRPDERLDGRGVSRRAQLAKRAPEEPEVDAAHHRQPAGLDGQERAGTETDLVVV